MMQVIIDALSNGGLYGLAALGVGLVFGVMRLVNFAHGELITCSAYLLVICLPWGLLPAVAISLVGATVLAFMLDLGVFSRLRGADPAVLLIASFGMSVLLQRAYEMIFGALPRSGQAAAWLSDVWTVGGSQVSRGSVVTVVLTIVLLGGMKLAVEHTTIGLQLRAASSDFKTAQLLGVRSSRVIAAAFAASGLLAGAVGFILFTQRGQADPLFGVNITILALVGTVIGGLGSLLGAAVGGIAVGASISILSNALGDDRAYTYSVLFVLVIVVLLVKPTGIFGQAALKERV
jgi:branched-chain amino acid transport system permease protein